MSAGAKAKRSTCTHISADSLRTKSPLAFQPLDAEEREHLGLCMAIVSIINHSTIVLQIMEELCLETTPFYDVSTYRENNRIQVLVIQFVVKALQSNKNERTFTFSIGFEPVPSITPV